MLPGPTLWLPKLKMASAPLSFPSLTAFVKSTSSQPEPEQSKAAVHSHCQVGFSSLGFCISEDLSPHLYLPILNSIQFKSIQREMEFQDCGREHILEVEKAKIRLVLMQMRQKVERNQI